MKTMKHLKFTIIILFFQGCGLSPQTELQKAIADYARAGDEQDAKTLASTTHDLFQVIWNGPDPRDHTLFSRDTYLHKFDIKEWGGDPRTVEIMDTEICGNYASVHVKMNGRVAVYESLLTMVNDNGQWKVLQESVMVSQNR
jgi:Putative lumazine-binding